VFTETKATMTARRGNYTAANGLAYHGGVPKRIGELLVEAGVLSQAQLEQALFAQRKDGRKLGQLLIELGLAGEVQLTQALSRQLSVPWVSLYHVDFSRSLLNLVPSAVAEKYCLIPIFVRRVRNQGETLYVAMDDPTSEGAIEEVTRASSLPVKPMIACPGDIRAAIRVYYLGEAPSPLPAPSAPVPQVTPVASPGAPSRPRSATPPPPLPDRARSRVDGPPEAHARERPSEGPMDIEAHEHEESTEPRRMRAKMISLTLLDGTTIAVPAPGRKPKPKLGAEGRPREELSDQLTARDLVSALRAVAHGVDAAEILGTEARWEAMFSALLSVLLRKGLIADWEFIEEFRKV
jgi:type IV pilus assembly protein PilB